MALEAWFPRTAAEREEFFRDLGRPRDEGGSMLRVSEPALIGNERRYVLDCLDRNELSWQGAYVRRFEEAFAGLCGTKDAVACCNGTAALHLALLALGIRPGDDVFVPALTYVATAAAVRHCGANPVLCDVLRDTWCLDPDAVRAAAKRSRRPRAIIPVHLYGVMADMDALSGVANDFGMDVVEDAAEAVGSHAAGRPAGSIGALGAFSFYANKTLTTGEGGAVVTSSPGLADRLRLYRGQGQTRQYFHEVVGYNYRMTNIQAAIGLAQVERFAAHVSARRSVARWYRDRLRGVEFQAVTPDTLAADWLCVVLLPTSAIRTALAQALALDGIETRPVFVPLTDMPPYLAEPLQVSSEIAGRGLCLPTHAGVTEQDVERVARVVEGVIAQAGVF